MLAYFLQAHSNVFPMIITTIAFQDTGIASKAVDLTSKVC